MKARNSQTRQIGAIRGIALMAKSLCRGQGKRTMHETEVQIGNSGSCGPLENVAGALEGDFWYKMAPEGRFRTIGALYRMDLNSRIRVR